VECLGEKVGGVNGFLDDIIGAENKIKDTISFFLF